MPTDWRTGLIIPVNIKGRKDKCENYGEITLLPQMYKILPSVLYSRVVRYVDITVGDYQNGVRSGRATAGNIFTLRQIIDNANEYNLSLHLLFVDLKQAFTSIKRIKIYEILQQREIPTELIRLI